VPPEGLLQGVERYYSGKFVEHGASARGVDWNSPESQELRFRQLLRLHDGSNEAFSIIDYGCGYGALVAYLAAQGYAFDYRGFDLSAEMLAHARAAYAGTTHVKFVDDPEGLAPADYTVASGIFNVKVGVEDDRWQEYVLETIGSLAALSRRGFAFNVLTSYSDADRMRPDLYYADPALLFDHCKRRYSRNVALLHDYELYEFTILVRLR
jgi:SAM-dependent methyltransferase